MISRTAGSIAGSISLPCSHRKARSHSATNHKVEYIAKWLQFGKHARGGCHRQGYVACGIQVVGSPRFPVANVSFEDTGIEGMPPIVSPQEAIL